MERLFTVHNSDNHPIGDVYYSKDADFIAIPIGKDEEPRLYFPSPGQAISFLHRYTEKRMAR